MALTLKEVSMIISGIADEGAPGLKRQIELQKMLGWQNIELRLIDKTNISEIDDNSFERVFALLQEEDMGVICFSSPIANWARPVTSDFSRDVDDLKRSVVRMRRLGTEYIRIMSYPNDGLEQREWRKEVFRRLKELTRIAAGENITLVHENCSGWGGRSAENLRILLEEMDSPNFQIVFDMGNPVAEGHPREESWSFYEAARPFIKHIHIKDCKLSEDGEVVYTYPAAGWSMVREIIADALAGGYKGAFSIEPHMAVQIHLGGDLAAGVDPEEVYLEYGRRANKLLEEL